ncbi:hypothetical protein OD917_19990 [Flavobacterium sp. SH_e]|uniref:hypothetical protein n=1 Tax=Flavobacterium TaxID=237 RepID=UPI0021E3D303|nr:hypothetical protein [Flavobacterium sp. SH_e]MCV2487225.1 hypothetical protein [Flavobacterium sp. SH_e]
MEEEKDPNFKIDPENFRMYYQLQYDRIDKLETKRENFCNFVLTLSSAIIVFSLSTDNRLSQYTNYLIALIIIFNVAAILFFSKTRAFIKMHQKRATIASEKFANELLLINKEVDKINSDGDLLNRNNIYSIIHFAIIVIMLMIFAMENKCNC